MRFDVWVCLREWLVGDGVIDGLSLGQHLHRVGVRANCWSARWGAGEDRVVDSAASGDTDVLPRSEVTGTVEWVQPRTSPYEAPVTLTLRVGDVRLLTLGPATELTAVDVGARVTLDCSLTVIADDEWGASALPDVRRSWAVRALRRCHWTAPSNRTSANPPELLEQTAVTEVAPWPEGPFRGPKPAMYRLQLAPVDHTPRDAHQLGTTPTAVSVSAPSELGSALPG
jgi:hypothetical protein